MIAHVFYRDHLPVFKAQHGDDLKQNTETINASNPKHLVFKALRGDNPEQIEGTIHASNPKHLTIFKALCRDNPRDYYTDSA